MTHQIQRVPLSSLRGYEYTYTKLSRLSDRKGLSCWVVRGHDLGVDVRVNSSHRLASPHNGRIDV